MPKNSQQTLILITGSPCVGKTTVAEGLFEQYENCAMFDGDWAWRVHPFSLDDPRLRNGDKIMSFALSTYLNSGFDYVIFPSVVVLGDPVRAQILHDITANNYTTISFALKCSEETLRQRHRQRGDATEVSFQWLRAPVYPGDHCIDTDGKTVAQVVGELKRIIDKN